MKTLLVTGACSDFGVAIIKEQAANYDRIVAQHFRMESGLNPLKEELGDKLIMKYCDFTSEEDTTRFATELVKEGLIPDHIIHLPAPAAKSNTFTKIPWSKYDLGFQICVRSIVIILQKLLPKMVKNGGGKVILMMSYAIIGIPQFSADYVTVKYAVYGLMKALSRDYEDKRILVNGIGPNFTETRFITDQPLMFLKESDMPFGAYLSTSDVTGVVDFLLSDKGNSISGQYIPIRVAGHTLFN